jgi:hypothetical protein
VVYSKLRRLPAFGKAVHLDPNHLLDPTGMSEVDVRRHAEINCEFFDVVAVVHGDVPRPLREVDVDYEKGSSHQGRPD